VLIFGAIVEHSMKGKPVGQQNLTQPVYCGAV
jgi:hypothetical protein